MVMLIIWSSVYIAELLQTFRPFWMVRRFLAPIVIVSIIASTILILPLVTPLFKIIISILAVYRIFNLVRIVKGRMHPYYLQYVSRRTSFWIATIHIVLFCVLSLVLSYVSVIEFFSLLSYFLTIVTLLMVIVVSRNISKMSYEQPSAFLADRHLPTVTVAVPARNETSDLEFCLKSILQSDYPKLEIIVYDDCSHQATSEVIKKFAHDGVRFIKGDAPQKRWLPKNQACQSLLEHSTGELVMFTGVDVRVQNNTVRDTVNTMYCKRKRMLSILPLRQNPSVKSVFIQPLRYWWELVPPRRVFNRPPVLSTCWIIDREFILSLGGFTAVSHAILPEVYFAKKAVETDDYSFIRSDDELGLMTAKAIEGQRSTAIRVKYPQLRRRIENVLLVSWLLLGLLFIPPAAVLYGISSTNVILVASGLLTYIAVLSIHSVVLLVTDPKNLRKGLLTYPVAMVAEIVLGYASMYQYEFGTVEWKGRNVCIPVMHVYPKLPNIDG